MALQAAIMAVLLPSSGTQDTLWATLATMKKDQPEAANEAWSPHPFAIDLARWVDSQPFATAVPQQFLEALRSLSVDAQRQTLADLCGLGIACAHEGQTE